MVVIIVDDREFNVDDTKTMLDAKEFIMKELELSCIYIDIEVCLDRPMRVVGKFNIEPGKLSRTFDRYQLNQFAFKDKLTVTLIEINDYDPHKPKKPFMSGGRGLATKRNVNPNQPKFNTNLYQVDITEDNKKSFNLSSQDDFPSLGS